MKQKQKTTRVRSQVKLVMSLAVMVMVAAGSLLLLEHTSDRSEALISDGANAIDALGQFANLGPTPTPVYTRSSYVTDTERPNQYGFFDPRDSEIDYVNHRLFVSDRQNNRILVYTLNASNQLVDKLPDFVLGTSDFDTYPDAFTNSASSTTYPYGLAFDPDNNWLFVADGDGRRVLVFDVATITNGENALYVLGQANFTNRNFSLTADGMSYPEGLALDTVNDRLFVSDSGYDRILIYDVSTITNGEAATIVLGQANFTTSGAALSSTRVSNPLSMEYDSTSHYLYVADDGNDRVLIFNAEHGVVANGDAAINVLGKPDFTTGGNQTTINGMSGPKGLALDTTNNRLYVGENGNNRVLVFDVTAITDGEDAISVLGQSDFTTSTITTSQPSTRKIYGVDIDPSNDRLYVVQSDGANRVSIFDTATITNGENAVDLIGQYDGSSASVPVAEYTKGSENNAPTPFMFSAGAFDVEVDETNKKLYVLDEGNDRVLVYNLNNDGTLNDYQADYVLGAGSLGTYRGGSAAANNFVGPRSMALAEDRNLLFVSDYTARRVLVFDVSTITNGEDAAYVLGQPDFTTTVASLTATGMDRPVGLAYDSSTKYLFVSDYGYDRVTVFDTTTITNGESAIAVLGQADFTTSGVATAANRLNNPWGITVDATNHRLFVADNGNNRTLVFDIATISDGENAASVLGQSDFVSSASALTATGQNGPINVEYDLRNDRLLVAEYSQSRIITYDVSTITDGEAATNVLGAPNLTSAPGGATLATVDAPYATSLNTLTNELYVAEETYNIVKVFDAGLAGFFITESGGSTAMNEGGTDTFDVVLGAKPASDVVITLTSADTTSVGVSHASLTFTTTNWNVAQTVTVTSLQDDDAEAENPLITLSIDDANSDNSFDPLADKTVAVTLTEDETASITTVKTGGSLEVTEQGATDTFTVALGAKPDSDVVLDVTSSDPTSVTVSTAQVTFTAANWSTPQTVTLTALDDVNAVAENVTVTLSVNDGASNDAYDPVADVILTMTVIDNDAAATATIGTTNATTPSGGGGGYSTSTDRRGSLKNVESIHSSPTDTGSQQTIENDTKCVTSEDCIDLDLDVTLPRPDTSTGGAYVNYMKKVRDNISTVLETCDFSNLEDSETRLREQPMSTISRGELVSLLVACNHFDPNGDHKQLFPDVPLQHSQANAIYTALEKGIIVGFPDGRFYPDRLTTREEALKMIVLSRHASGNLQGMAEVLRDVVNTEWYAQYVGFAFTRGIITGYLNADGTLKNMFGVGDYIKRGDAAEMIIRTYRLE